MMNTINNNTSIDLVVNDISTKNSLNDKAVDQETTKNIESKNNENQPRA